MNCFSTCNTSLIQSLRTQENLTSGLNFSLGLSLQAALTVHVYIPLKEQHSRNHNASVFYLPSTLQRYPSLPLYAWLCPAAHISLEFARANLLARSLERRQVLALLSCFDQPFLPHLYLAPIWGLLSLLSPFTALIWNVPLWDRTEQAKYRVKKRHQCTGDCFGFYR